MIPRDWVLPVPAEWREYKISIPHGMFYEELIYGAISELSQENVDAATEADEYEVQSTFLRILNSISLNMSGGSGTMFASIRRTTTIAENLPPSIWTTIVPTHVEGSAALAGSGVVLPAGTWLVRWSVYARQGAQCESRLLKNGSAVARGIMGFAGNISGAPSVLLPGSAIIEVTSVDVLSLQCWFRIGGSLAAPSLTDSGEHTCMVADFIGV